MSDMNTFWAFIIVFVIALMSIFTFSSGYSGTSATGNIVAAQPLQPSQLAATGSASRDVQVVKLKVQGSSYILEPSTFKKGTPVRIEADTSQMPGCSKSVVISAFNVRKTLSGSDNTIEFTPSQAGTFNIACSMNMYKGTFTVLQTDGTKAAYVQPAAAGGSCGAGGGGCGCGG
jgi:hypothetical protein